jgi:hypothetical protein
MYRAIKRKEPKGHHYTRGIKIWVKNRPAREVTFRDDLHVTTYTLFCTDLNRYSLKKLLE